MPPKTRGSRKATTASQSQSALLPNNESYQESYEAASVPSDFTIIVPCYQSDLPLNEAFIAKAQVDGEEAGSDANRKEGDSAGEGKLEVKWSEKGVKRRRVGFEESESFVDDKGKLCRLVDGEDVPLWYTAGLSFPCLCDQARYPIAYRSRVDPPRSSTLLSLPPHEAPSACPISTKDLPAWDAPHHPKPQAPAEKDDLYGLKDFELGWRAAKGGWGHAPQPVQVRIDHQEMEWEEPQVAGPSGVRRDGRGGLLMDDEDAIEEVRLPLSEKGKGKAREVTRIDTAAFRRPLLPLRFGLADKPRQADDGIRPSTRTTENVAGGIHLVSDWDTESKRRKRIWRDTISSDEGYEMMWKVIPRPHSYVPLPRAPRSRKSHKPLSTAPDYVLPRALSIQPHPFHPDLSHYINQHPYGRLYWLIPIHGPVHIPSINNFPSIPGPNTTNHALSPSYGTLATKQPFVDPTTRPFPLLWTPPLLNCFMNMLIALYQDQQQPLGALSIRLSGPKPDPFLDLAIQKPLNSHVHIPPPLPAASEQPSPVRPECGDHLRVYVDAKHALSLRSWLYSVDIPWADVGDHGTRHAHEKKSRPALAQSSSGLGASSMLDTQLQGQGAVKQKRGGLRLFNKVRLALVGEKGEVLVVA